MADQKEDIIETFDEQGNKVSFELVDIVTVDDIEYALLLPIGIEDNNDEELLVMRLKKEGEEFSFEAIEDDDELNKVAQYVEELEDEIDD